MFCLEEEKPEIELVLKLLYKRGSSALDENQNGSGESQDVTIPKMYHLEDLIVTFHRELKKALKHFGEKPREQAEKYLSQFNSTSAAQYKFETTYFNEIPACPFHEVSCMTYVNIGT